MFSPDTNPTHDDVTLCPTTPLACSIHRTYDTMLDAMRARYFLEQRYGGVLLAYLCCYCGRWSVAAQGDQSWSGRP